MSRNEEEIRADSTPKPGVSLAWKVTLPIALGAGVAAALLWTNACRKATEAVEREIDAAGAHLVEALALPDPESWSSVKETFLDTVERLVAASPEYEELLRVKYGIVFEDVPDSNRRKSLSDEFRAEQERALEEFDLAKEANRNRLSRLLSFVAPVGREPPRTRVVDAYVLRESTGRSIVRAQNDGEAFVARGEARRFHARADSEGRTEVRIRDGSFDERPARAFEAPIRNAEGETTHRAFVFLATDEAQAALAAMRERTLPIALIGLALAWAAAYVVTRVVTAPMKRLRDDALAIAEGDLHHRSSVKTDDEIGMLARTLDTMVRRIDHAMADHDDEVAAELHRKLVAEEIPYLKGIEVSVLPILTRSVGGAYYDMLELPERKVGFVLAEASTRGIPAAINVCMAGALLRSEGRTSGDPAELLRRVHEPIERSFHSEMSLDAVVAVLDPAARKVRLAGAGELPVFVRRAATGALEQVRLPGSALGAAPGPVFEASLENVELLLEPGDRLLLTNDGAERLENVRGEALGRERWRSFVERACALPAGRFDAELRQLLRGYVGRGEIEDDIVVLSLYAEPTAVPVGATEAATEAAAAEA